MIVDGVEHLAADDRAHLLDHPLAARIGVLAGQRHAGEILLAEIRVLMQHGWRDVDPVLAAGELEEDGRGLVAEAARAEVHADPDQALLVLEQVHVVVARSDGAELIPRHLLEVADRLDLLPERAVEQRVFDLLMDVALVTVEAQTESDIVENAHRERIRLLEHHPDKSANDHRIDGGSVNVLPQEMDMTLEPKPGNHVVHSVEAAQHRALAAARRPNKTGDRPLWHRQTTVAHRHKLPIIDFADVAFDRDFLRQRRERWRLGDVGLHLHGHRRPSSR